MKCANCGAPVKSLEQTNCQYCGGLLVSRPVVQTQPQIIYVDRGIEYKEDEIYHVEESSRQYRLSDAIDDARSAFRLFQKPRNQKG